MLEASSGWIKKRTKREGKINNPVVGFWVVGES